MKTRTLTAGLIAALLALTACTSSSGEPETDTPTTTAAASSKYPAIAPNSPGEAYLDRLTEVGIDVGTPAMTVIHGDAACQHINAGDHLAALEYLTDEAGYTADERTKVHTAAVMHLCDL